MKDKNIIVYSTPTCPYCVMAKTFLSERGIAFEDIDVSKDPVKVEEMLSKSGQLGVPVLDIDGKIVIGFQPDVVADLLELDQ